MLFTINPKVEDIVLVRYDSKLSKGDYRLARISNIHPDANGIVRTVSVKMRPRDSREQVQADPPYLLPKTPVEIQLGIQRICVILPVEEQAISTQPPTC